ncbi:MAG TPA: restriction endonuclease subunit S [Polyangia bacterium]|nr:restriction endonuclease subunit S [Polyangia bacterium]
MPTKTAWPLKVLHALASKIGSGATPDGGRESYFTKGIPLIRSMNVHFHGFDPTGLVFLSDQQAAELANVTVQADDVLLNITGASIGRVTTAPAQMAGARVNQHVTIIRPTTELFPSFLAKFLASPTVQRMIAEIQVGATRQALTKGMIEQFEIPLPPLAEQKRIVAKVDELMALCDRLEAQLQERDTQQAALARAALARFADAPTPANLNLLFHDSFTITPADLRKTILTLAVQGHLVPQDPNEESAATLLDRLQKQKRRLHESDALRATKPCREFTPEDVPHAIPDSWVWTMLAEVTDIGTGSTPSRTQPAYWSDGSIPWVTSGSTSSRVISSGDEFVTAVAVKAHRLRLYPAGTLLVALYGQGKTRGQVAVLGISATINQACAAICPLDGLPSMQSYLRLLLEKQYDEVRLLAAGGAQPNLNVQKIKELFVPLPPLAEQRRIVAKVDQLTALVDQWESQLAAACNTADHLLSALVAELTAA